jgi:hypothetical protein
MKKRTSGINCKKKKLIAVKQPNGRYKREEIRSLKGRSLWENFLIFFNSIGIGEQFTRLQLLEATYEKNITSTIRSDVTSVDTYRAYLSKLNIVKYSSRGVYEKQLNLPPDMTLTKIRKASKDIESWKGWFIPLHERLEVKEEDLKS